MASSSAYLTSSRRPPSGSRQAGCGRLQPDPHHQPAQCIGGDVLRLASKEPKALFSNSRFVDLGPARVPASPQLAASLKDTAPMSVTNRTASLLPLAFSAASLRETVARAFV